MPPILNHGTADTPVRSFVYAAASVLLLATGARAGAAGAPAGGFGMGTVGGLEGRVIRVTSREQEHS